MDPRITTLILDEPNLPRLLLSDQTATLESDFTTVALRVLNRLYSSCYVIRFSPAVDNEGVRWKPDLAVIAHDLSFWFVIEVEIGTHSLEKHVVPQVIGLRDGDYNVSTADIISRSIGLPIDNVAAFVKFVPRYVAVISNIENDIWTEKLRAHNVQFISIAEFRRSGGQGAYLVTGLLEPAKRSLGIGQVLANQQAIRLPAGAAWKKGEYQILDESGVTTWICDVQDGMAWLYKVKGLILHPDHGWVQFMSHENNLVSLRRLSR